MVKLAILMFFLTLDSLFAAAMVVSDPVAQQTLGDIYEKNLQASEKLTAIELFTSKMNDNTEQIYTTLAGNREYCSAVTNSSIFYHDYFKLNNENLPNLKNSSNPSRQILNFLGSVYEQVKIPSEDSQKYQKQQYQQACVKSSLILSERVIKNISQRNTEISGLADESDSTINLKEAMDMNNRLLLEILVELRNNNLLLASSLRSKSSVDFKGDLIITASEPVTYQKRTNNNLNYRLR